jgi:uncharacterized protein YbjT (DUF2867 family)
VTGKVLVTGGTGTLGKAVVDRLLEQNAGEIAVASRRPAPPAAVPYQWVSVDYADPASVDAALAGIDVVIHCLNDQRANNPDRVLIDAARRVGTVRLVHISIVGIDDVALGYYRRKLDTERLIDESGVPYTILRTTQFHDLVATWCRQLSGLPVAVAPSVPLQPVEVREVAARMVELAAMAPAGRVADLGGPQVRPFGDLMRAYLTAKGTRKPVLPLALPGKLFRAVRDGQLLAPDHADGQVTFEDYLTAR